MYKLANKLPSVEILKEKFEIDPSIPSGLRWKVERRGPKTPGNSAGRSTQGYYQTRVNGVHFYNSRIIWKMINGNDPENVIDHIDGNPSNNNLSNLQDITQSQNLRKKAGEIINA